MIECGLFDWDSFFCGVISGGGFCIAVVVYTTWRLEKSKPKGDETGV